MTYAFDLFQRGDLVASAVVEIEGQNGNYTMQLSPFINVSVAMIASAIGASVMASDAPGLMVPSNLQSPATHGRALELSAHGVQIYVCTESMAAPGNFVWNFVAPEADLFDASGALVGKHYAGPTWQSLDGSKVVAEIKARHDAPAGTDIPWLLLEAKEHMGFGAFSNIGAIQRLSTQAGKAPATGCGRDQVGNEARVPYKAVYRLYSVS